MLRPYRSGGLNNLEGEYPNIVGVHDWRLDSDRIARLNAGGVHAGNRLDRELVALIAGLPACKRVPISIS